MSEIINNREYRQKVLKELILELHAGKTVDEVKGRFEKLIEGVSASEISQMEQALIAEGMPVEEVQRLCDVHAAVFKGSIEDIHKEITVQSFEKPGHPVHTFKQENRAIEDLINNKIKPALKQQDRSNVLEGLRELLTIENHYSRKENLLFPYLEKNGITAPPKVMWGVDDEIRAEIKNAIEVVESDAELKNETKEIVSDALVRVDEMIFKEENILLPMAIETLSEDEWYAIYRESDQIGYTLINQDAKWEPVREDVGIKAVSLPESISKEQIRFETGVVSIKEMELMLNHLPFDITFVDKDDTVKYFSHGKERIFERTKAVIGRKVANCHPPGSVHIVEKIVADFKAGKKDVEEFWIQQKDRFIHIRYFAVRDENGEYLGTMEVSQNIQPLRELTGEKRLLSEI